jgi:general secretion pathway protein G
MNCLECECIESNLGERGLTLVELIVAFTVLSLLTTMAVPLARYKVRIEQEKELRYALRTITKAIDDYKDASVTGKIEVKLGTDGYPESLEQLVKGVKLLQSADGKVIKFLRRIPKDPMTNSYDWGLRSNQDDPDSKSWGGQNVFSVYTKSLAKARDGTPYSEW